MHRERIVVIGASAGGVRALIEICRGLPAEFSAPVCMVLHVGSHRSLLPEILSSVGALSASHPFDGQKLEPGRIYIAPSDQHMRVEGNVIRLSRGPKEHHSRPAIDPLFRSAALSYANGVIGVVLTGRLDDGTPGMQAIKHFGGTCIVQDPVEAEEPSMPLSVCKYVEVDHAVPVSAIAPLLVKLLESEPERNDAMETSNVSAHEEALSLGTGDAMEHLRAIASPSTFTCPDCAGTLWEVESTSPKRYRCHTGHAFTLESLRSAQSASTDVALWAAIRALQEKRELLLVAMRSAVAEGDTGKARQLEADAAELFGQAVALRALVAQVDETEL